MSIGASSEFISLCRSQLSLLQSWGAAYSTVYLTEKLDGGTKTHFVPLLVYPDLPDAVVDSSLGILPAGGSGRASEALELDLVNVDFGSASAPKTSSLVPNNLLKLPYEIFLPLIHEQLVMGLLVTARQDRSWNHQEKQQIEKIGQSLAIACVIARQQVWLKEQLIQQQKLQSRQKDLLDNLLHQIRSPLTAIRTFGKLLLKRLLAGNRDREIVAGIIQQSDRLKELLEQIDASLDLSDRQALILEANTSIELNSHDNSQGSSSLLLLPGSSPQDEELETEPCDLVTIIQPLILSAKAIAQEKEQQILANIAPNLPPILANPPALREVLSNIIDNALKYTPVGGSIWLEVGTKETKFSRNPGFLEIAIADNGCGINDVDLQRIFERSYRGVQANTDIPGTGLGLAIAKELVEKMGGKIEVYSPPPPEFNIPRGTVFSLWLPMGEKF